MNRDKDIDDVFKKLIFLLKTNCDVSKRSKKIKNILNVIRPIK